MSQLLLTGCTGLLGSTLLRDALVARQPVAALVRSQSRRSGPMRLEELLQFWEAQLGRSLPRPVILEGDLHEPALGLDAADVRWLSRHCDGVLHCAARVSFEADDVAGEPERTNVGGVEHALELCQAAGIGRFFHVSTAYVAGARRGAVAETDSVGQEGFNNEYERTKAAAEQLVRTARFLQSATIFRPSIIVGDSQTGFAPAFHGIYTPLRLGYLHLLAKLREGWQLDEALVEEVVGGQFVDRMGLTGDERKNLVPVDWVSRAILGVVNEPSASGLTYHVTHRQPVTIADLAASMVDAALRYLDTSPTLSPGIPESLLEAHGFREHMQVYRSYLSDDPAFACDAIANVPGVGACPLLDHETLVRLWSWAIGADFSWRAPPARTAEWDLATIFERDLPLAEGASVHLEVTGPGGGAWRLTSEGSTLQGAELAAASGLPRIALSSQTMADLLTGRLQLDAALDECRVAAFGHNPRQLIATYLPPVINWLALERPPATITRQPQHA